MHKLSHAEISINRKKIDEIDSVQRNPIYALADNIRSLYRNAVQAGSDLFLTNSFGGNAVSSNFLHLLTVFLHAFCLRAP